MRALAMDDPLLAARPDLSEPGDLPGHVRIADWLEHLILSTTLQPGDKLPPEVEIATALGVSRMTLRQALGTVEAKGLLDRRRGRFGGSFVATPRFEFDHAGLPGFTEQMRRLHVEAGAAVLQASTTRPGAEIRRALNLKRADRVHEILRARSANGEPIVLEETYFPADLFPGLLAADLTGSLYSVMNDYGLSPYTADESIEATAATDHQAAILQVEPNFALLMITRTSYAENGVPVEFSRDYHRSDRSRIRIKSKVDRDPSVGVYPAS